MRIDRKIDAYKKRRKTRVTFELTTDYYNFITRPFINKSTNTFNNKQPHFNINYK